MYLAFELDDNVEESSDLNSSIEVSATEDRRPYDVLVVVVGIVY